MKTNKEINRFFAVSLLGLAAAVSLTSAGCAVYTNGMTLPTPFYQENRVQYFPRGTEFPLPNEAANLQETNPEYHPQN